MLKGYLYEIESFERTSEGCSFAIVLNGNCEVYKAHFPGMAITPGAALVKIAEELSGEYLGYGCRIRSVKDVKFLSIIKPDEAESIRFLMRRTAVSRGRAGMEVTVQSGDILCARFSLLLSHFCAIVPTYNNSSTLIDVLSRVLNELDDVFVVCDGCTDGTETLLHDSGIPVRVISYRENSGKGAALKKGFAEALAEGYDYAVTIDSDGQHFPEDIALMLEAVAANPGAMVIGSRDLNSENMPSGNSFANKFSNFWFRIQTGVGLPDTQTGFRVYPLTSLPPLSLIAPRYESELEILVLMAWKSIPIVPVPVRVTYPEDRVSHFRPFSDFARISILNVLLCTLALLYGYPRKLLHKLSV